MHFLPINGIQKFFVIQHNIMINLIIIGSKYIKTNYFSPYMFNTHARREVVTHTQERQKPWFVK